jgi:CheY-like chemotaxis protein
VILVADDDDDVRAVLILVLVEEGYVVLEAVDGQQALEIARRSDVDLILLDYAMPALDGAGFCRAYGAGGGRAPVLLLTAANADDAVAAARACGAVAHVPKPFEMDELLGAVERWAAR